jgi:putative lipoprotein
MWMLLTALVVSDVLGPRIAYAQEDAWFARDKAGHFVASAALAVGGYVAGVGLFDCKRPRVLLGGSVALAAGVAKEALDASGSGRASWRDLVWDVIGTAAGLGLAWSIDGDPARCDDAERAPAGLRTSPEGLVRPAYPPARWPRSAVAEVLCPTVEPALVGPARAGPRIPRALLILRSEAKTGRCP